LQATGHMHLQPDVAYFYQNLPRKETGGLEWLLCNLMPFNALACTLVLGDHAGCCFTVSALERRLARPYPHKAMAFVALESQHWALAAAAKALLAHAHVCKQHRGASHEVQHEQHSWALLQGRRPHRAQHPWTLLQRRCPCQACCACCTGSAACTRASNDVQCLAGCNLILQDDCWCHAVRRLLVLRAGGLFGSHVLLRLQWHRRSITVWGVRKSAAWPAARVH
jgi:hypothetical protein